jgi:uncharacterized cupin superfamily protein
MPIIRKDDAPVDSPDIPDTLGNFTARLFSDAGGLTQFGAFTETLHPGSRSSHKHWHQTEDEFIFVIAGTVIVHEGDTSTEIGVGDAACFPAGAEVGHCLENASAEDVTYLVVGTRAPKDVVTYPDKDRRLIFDRTTRKRRYEHLDGTPGDAPE